MNSASQTFGELRHCRDLRNIKFEDMPESKCREFFSLPLQLPEGAGYLVRSDSRRYDVYETTCGITRYAFPDAAMVREPVVSDTEIAIWLSPQYGNVPLLVLHKAAETDAENLAPSPQAEARAQQVSSAIQQAAVSPGATKVTRE